MSENDTKKCPYCGEEILSVAKKCRYCGEWLYKTRGQTQQQYIIQASSDGCFGIALKTIAVVITILIVLALLPVIGEILMLLVLSSGS